MAKPVAEPTMTDPNASKGDDGINDSIMGILGTEDDPGVGDNAAPAPAEPPAEPAPEPPAEPAPEPPAEPEPGAIPDGVAGVSSEPPSPPAGEGDDSDDTPEDAKSGKGKNAWSKIKAEKKELKEKVAALEAQIAANKENTPPEMQDVLNLQKQLEEKENMIGQLDVTRTQAFQTKFDVPMERTLKRGEALLVRSGMSEAEAQTLVGRMLATKNAQEVSDMIADQPIALQGALMNVVSEYEQMAEDRTMAINNWRETQLALEHNEQRSEEITLAQNIEKDTAEAVQAAVTEGNFLFTKTNGTNEEWDAAVDERTKLVKGILHTSKAGELVKWVVEGVTAKPVRDAYLAERNKVIELTKKLQAINSRAPSVGAAGDPPAAPASPDKARSPDDIIGGMFG